ncbi:ATP-binding protein [Clostridium rectalis]|uniref:PAS domain-containing sensor histidine kinase n=1 Tax=Clostridium rectalis TaxID=2040295 RepID=UPI000F63B6A7|nr:ATP-binding protein [Clostridium rectalis]
MSNFYESIPFGVILLRGDPLKVDYINSRAEKILNVNRVLNEEINKLPFYSDIINIVKKVKFDNKERYLRNIKIHSGKFIDVTINSDRECVRLFIAEIPLETFKENENSIFKNDKVTINVLEALPHLIYITDIKGEVKYVNDGGTNKLLKKDLIKMENIFDHFKVHTPYDENEKPLNIIQLPAYRSLEYGEEIINKVLLYKFNNQNVYISVSSFPIYNSNKIIGLVCICLDVTGGYLNRLKEKEEREKFLSLSTELKTKCDIIEILRMREKEHLMHLKDVINNISEGILVVDSNHKISICNNSVHDILGLKQIELTDYKNIIRKYTINIDEGEKVLEEYYRDYYMKNKPIRNMTLKLTDNGSKEVKYIEFNSNPIIKSNGKLVYIIITIKDVTEKRCHQIYAEEQAEFVKNVVNTLDVPIAVLDYPRLKYKLLNEQFVKMISKILGRNFLEKEIMEKSILETSPDLIDSKSIVKLYNAVKYKEELVLPIYCINESGEEKKYYKVKVVPYTIKENIVRIYIHGLDVTEEINHNLELEKVNKMKDEFFTIISHELRTPLTIIYSALQLAYDIYKKELTPNIDKTLNRIKQNCSRLLKLTNNIMDISEADAGFLSINNNEFELVLESENIVNYSNYYARKKGINIIFDTNEEECIVNIDIEKYQRILLNLISNAIKYTPENKNIYVLLHVKEDEFCISIKDEGVGIPEDKIEFIFDRYSQINSTLSRRAEGTGLGLAIVKKFVEVMQGDIKVNSKEMQGSEFIITLKKQSPVKDTTNKCVTLNENFDDIVSIEMSDIY